MKGGVQYSPLLAPVSGGGEEGEALEEYRYDLVLHTKSFSLWRISSYRERILVSD
jgi:hypothetical protein